MVFHICRLALRRGFQAHISAVKSGGVGGWTSKLAPLAQPCQLQVQSHRCKVTSNDNLITFIFGHKFMHKFDERSKIIVVDGNIGCGKSKFSQELADRLGMKHVPEAHVHYLDELELGKGKKYDPKYIGNVSLERFYKDPFDKDGHSFRFQTIMYAMRFRQYADVIEHLLNTGQGLVMERSVYSDYVFMEAMFKMGYFRRACRDYYNEVKGVSLYRLRPPHLVIYLDTPVDVLQKRLKKRGGEMEAHIPDEYLQHIKDIYKDGFLPEISETSEVLQYDWSNYGEVEQVIEDINMLKFKHIAWNDDDNITLDRLYRFVSNKYYVARCMDIFKYLPEITVSGHQMYDLTREFAEKFNKHYAPGYNLKEGESWWKLLLK